MAEIETSISAAVHKHQRTLHTNEMSTSNKRQDNAALQSEVQALEARFEQASAEAECMGSAMDGVRWRR